MKLRVDWILNRAYFFSLAAEGKTITGKRTRELLFLLPSPDAFFLFSHSLCIDNCRLIFSFPSFGGLTTLSSLGSFSLSLSLAFIDSTFDSLTRSVWLAARLAGRLFQFHSVVQCSSSSRGRLLLRLLLGLHDLIKLWNYTKLNYVALCSGECWWRYSVDGAAVVVVVTKCDEVCTVRRERLCATIIQTIPTASSSSLDE